MRSDRIVLQVKDAGGRLTAEMVKLRYQMTARTDRSDLSRYSPAYATERELGMNAAQQILRRLGRATEARTRPAADYSISATISVVPDPLVAQPFARKGFTLLP